MTYVNDYEIANLKVKVEFAIQGDIQLVRGGHWVVGRPTNCCIFLLLSGLK